MFIILLEFSANKDKASEHMQGHKAWLEKGFAQGIFVVSGSIKPKAGGGIVAHGVTFEELTHFVAEDPFVKAGVVQAKIIELDAFKADERLQFLLA